MNRACAFQNRFAVLAYVLLCTGTLLAQRATVNDAESAWAAIVTLDQGPKRTPKDPQEVAQISLEHLERQIRALTDFLTRFPNDPRHWEAKGRLARAYLRSGTFGRPDAERNAEPYLRALESAPLQEPRAEGAFIRITQRMRRYSVLLPPIQEREALKELALDFKSRFPTDRRAALLLYEVALLFDHQPETARSLLSSVVAMPQGAALKAQVADDFIRLGWLGKQAKFSFSTLGGDSMEMAKFSGRPVILLFFAMESAGTAVAWENLRAVLAGADGGDTVCVGYCVDPDRTAVEAWRKANRVPYAIGWNAAGWKAPVLRQLGMTSVPSIWLIDRAGIVRSLDARLDLAAQLRSLRR